MIPDIVFPNRKTVIFIDECIAHQGHGADLGGITPKQLRGYNAACKRVVAKMRKIDKEMVSKGWTSIRFWECEIDGIDFLATVKGIIKGRPSGRKIR